MTDLAAPAPATAPALADVEITLTGWTPRTDLTFEQWEDAGRQLGVMGRACQWWIGDWIRYGEQRFGERYSQAIEETGLSYQTLANCVYVATAIDPSRRRETLSWSHHAEVASLPADEADAWLERAEAERLTREKLRTALKRAAQPAPEPSGTETATVVFTTTLVVEHDATDYPAACAAIEQATSKLEANGIRVINTRTEG